MRIDFESFGDILTGCETSRGYKIPFRIDLVSLKHHSILSGLIVGSAIRDTRLDTTSTTRSAKSCSIKQTRRRR